MINNAILYLRVVENVWKKKVEKSPEFMEIILQRCSGNQQTVRGCKLANNFRELGFLILDTVGLVNNHVTPAELSENSSFLHYNLI